jgi:hypothetical protein
MNIGVSSHDQTFMPEKIQVSGAVLDILPRTSPGTLKLTFSGIFFIKKILIYNL